MATLETIKKEAQNAVDCACCICITLSKLVCHKLVHNKHGEDFKLFFPLEFAQVEDIMGVTENSSSQ